MTSWDDHVREIRREPEADAPRLVCADWLLEQGEPRGEFIVLDCRIAELKARGEEGDELARLVERRDEIRRDAEWLAPLLAAHASPSSPAGPPRLRRGFVEQVMLSKWRPASFPALCRLEPIVDLILDGISRELAEALAATDELVQLRSLAINAYDWEELARSPRLAALERLTLYARLSLGIATALADGAIRPRRIAHADAGLEPLVLLAEVGFYDRLEQLTVYNASDASLAAIARAPLAGLRSLQIRSSTLSEAAFDALGPRLDQLTELDLGALPLDRSIVDSLIRWMPSGRLRELASAGNAAALRPLFDSPAFDGVESLDLRRSGFAPGLLERSRHRGRLRRLAIGPFGERRDYQLEGVVVTETLP